MRILRLAALLCLPALFFCASCANNSNQRDLYETPSYNRLLKPKQKTVRKHQYLAPTVKMDEVTDLAVPTE